MKKCPLCDSPRIVHFRLDSDWASGAGNWSRVNEESAYEDWQVKQIEDNERQDIETYYCYSCCRCFDEPTKQKE